MIRKQMAHALAFQSAYNGQVSPKWPTIEERREGRTVNGPVQWISDSVTAQRGPFDAMWFRLWNAGVWRTQLTPYIEEYLNDACSNNSALYVAIQETCIEGHLVEYLKSKRFQFYCHEGESFVYYSWKGPQADRVPSYSSA
eukprot:GEMP01044226.1.p1 GENE.GEMP01044226.1~~GEMP01044226.1.p1  ORF type:complete len:141 (+),score=21.99 GEMP01044226.1:109-531(+)